MSRTRLKATAPPTPAPAPAPAPAPSLPPGHVMAHPANGLAVIGTAAAAAAATSAMTLTSAATIAPSGVGTTAPSTTQSIATITHPHPMMPSMAGSTTTQALNYANSVPSMTPLTAAAAAASAYSSMPFLMPTPSSTMHVHVLRLAPGADVMPSLNEFLRVHRCEAATILSAVGSLTHVNLRFANVSDENTKPLPVAHYEIVSLVGMISLSSNSHIHMCVSDSTGKCTGGHLMPTGNLIYTTLELSIGVLPGLIFKRERDPTFGYNELVVYPSPVAVQPQSKFNPLGFLTPDMSMTGMTHAFPHPHSSYPSLAPVQNMQALHQQQAVMQQHQQQHQQHQQQQQQQQQLQATAAAQTSLKRKGDEELFKPVAQTPLAKKQKSNAGTPGTGSKVKKEGEEEKTNASSSHSSTKSSSSSKINTSTVTTVLTLANMPLVSPNNSNAASTTTATGSPTHASSIHLTPSPSSSSSPTNISSIGATSSTANNLSSPSSSQSQPAAQLWTASQFNVFLKSLKLDHLSAIFQWHKIDAKQFLELKLTDIRDRLGIRDPADVQNVQNCIQILRGTTASSQQQLLLQQQQAQTSASAIHSISSHVNAANQPSTITMITPTSSSATKDVSTTPAATSPPSFTSVAADVIMKSILKSASNHTSKSTKLKSETSTEK